MYLYQLYYKWNTTTLVLLLCILFIYLALACQPVFACDLSRMNPLPFSQEFPPLSSPHLMSYVPLMFDQWKERERGRQIDRWMETCCSPYLVIHSSSISGTETLRDGRVDCNEGISRRPNQPVQACHAWVFTQLYYSSFALLSLSQNSLCIPLFQSPSETMWPLFCSSGLFCFRRKNTTYGGIRNDYDNEIVSTVTGSVSRLIIKWDTRCFSSVFQCCPGSGNGTLESFLSCKIQ